MMPELSGLEREGRLLPRLTAAAFDGVDERCFLAADKSARTDADLNIKAEAGTEDVRAEKTAFLRLLQRDTKTLDSQRVFSADVDIALVGADDEAADDHGLNDAVGISLKDAPVHKRAGVALVGVAY